MPSITSGNTTSGVIGLIDGRHRPSDTYKIALIRKGYTGTYGRHTATYSELGSDEVVAPGYSAGGMILTNRIVGESNGLISISFDPAVWPSSTIQADGAVIYNSTDSNAVLAVLSFGGTVISTKDVFTITGSDGSIKAFRFKLKQENT